MREFIRRLEAVGLTVESTPSYYRVLREGKPPRKQNGMPFSVLFGLSRDYQVFRLSRIKERRDASGSTTDAVSYGVSSTAPWLPSPKSAPIDTPSVVHKGRVSAR